ncbi:hypothetical protein QN362_05575 [Actimicrobium sp. CCC2.4]|uniref:hypothetical protein n=2 Tax=Actimicrobium sp. CCC2.4 TaxID=3048606 RepID=UPI002AC8DDD8|nr:hypothetical protein [Actimicrobium sp. CCC2.4]MEB0134796.1 hypothetical protein [Actimicrobium sp. CCC2.4]WPX30734.1 hypothetical protein RHM62_10660 [Actimicrobium sp. CCC2.4]
MSHLDILLPFALPPTAMGPDLLRAMETPSLAVLLARSKPAPAVAHDAFAHALPHESWLAAAFGLSPDKATDGSPPLALRAMHRRGFAPESGVWFVLNPVHIHIARDHLVLTDPRRLALADADSRTLFALAAPLFEEIGQQLVYGDAATWFLRADDWTAMQTATPDAACGHNIDIWMPKGPSERDWRKVQNEIQMHWHDCTVNQSREQQGLDPVNSLWLWAGTPAKQDVRDSPYTDVFNLANWRGETVKHADSATIADVLAAKPVHGLLLLDMLIEPALGEDLSEWLMRVNALEAPWFAPLLQALKDGALGSCRLILTHGSLVTGHLITRTTLRKFWLKPSLKGLLQ